MPPRRNFLDMNELVDKWIALGSKTLPKYLASKPPKTLGNKTHKRLTAVEQLAKTERQMENNLKDEDDNRVLAPVRMREPSEIRTYSEEPVLDPTTICVYCDALLPRDPSPLLLSLYESALAQSYADVRNSNIQGLKTSINIRSRICYQHNFERVELVKARYEQWPSTIDFKVVETRLKTKKAQFDALINDSTPNGPRQENVFWKRALSLLNKSQGLAGDINNFDKTQIGYYGEQGLILMSTIFSRLLYITEESTVPLKPLQFVALVLTPEAGVLLIMEDRPYLTREEAITTMRQSSAYGVHMFPDLDSV
ncbi:hypothetical protein C8R44DRAFT_885387 [Mycena epipterygia]|nr:hypothetical protein C8R44DRAFT_885387 [Mycena epipterygia]